MFLETGSTGVMDNVHLCVRRQTAIGVYLRWQGAHVLPAVRSLCVCSAPAVRPLCAAHELIKTMYQGRPAMLVAGQGWAGRSVGCRSRTLVQAIACKRRPVESAQSTSHHFQGSAGRERRHLLDEPIGKRRGQRRDGEVLLIPENRPDQGSGLPHARCSQGRRL